MRRSFAVFCTLLLLALPAKAGPADVAQRCALTFCYVAAGVPCFVERSVHDLLRIPLSLVLPRLVKLFGKYYTTGGDKADFAFTSRGPIEYADLAGLYTYDFRNKKVLDIAGGSGRFAQVVNTVYGHTGTKATVLDLFAPPPSILPGNTRRVKADAFAMPFSDKEFDLTVNNWMAVYYISAYWGSNPLRDPVQGPKARKALESLLYEQIRVTADGGQARIGMGMTYTGTTGVQNEMLQLTQFLLQNHPRVESVQFNYHVPMGHSITVKLKEKPSDEAPRQFHADVNFRPEMLKPVEWKARGFALLPAVFTASAAYATWSYLGISDEDKRLVESVQADLKATEEELREQLPQFAFVVMDPPRKGHEKEDLQNARRAMANVRAWVKRLPKDRLKPFQLLILKHDPKGPQGNLDGTLQLSTKNTDLMKLTTEE